MEEAVGVEVAPGTFACNIEFVASGGCESDTWTMLTCPV